MLHLHDVILFVRCTTVWCVSVGSWHEGFTIKTHSTHLRCSCRDAQAMHSSQKETVLLVTWRESQQVQRSKPWLFLGSYTWGQLTYPSLNPLFTKTCTIYGRVTYHIKKLNITLDIVDIVDFFIASQNNFGQNGKTNFKYENLQWIIFTKFTILIRTKIKNCLIHNKTSK